MTEPAIRRAAARRLWACNIVLACILGFSYLLHLPPRADAVSILFAPLALASTMILLSLPAGLVFQLVASLPLPRAGAVLQAVGWSLLQLGLFVDTRIYELFRFHFNGMIWSLLTTPGTGDSIALGRRTLTIVAVSLAALVGGELAALIVVQRRLRRALASVERRPLLRRRGALVAACLAGLVVADKSVHAWADLAGERRVLAVSPIVPGYMRLTVRRFAKSRLGHELAHPEVDALDSSLLDYPKEPIVLPKGGPRPNVLMIAVDSLRRDMLAPETMPRCFAEARASRVFDDHLSAGNQTRHGVFGMLYGLPGSYWTPVLSERRAPVLLDALGAAGYDVRAFASASLDSPELRDTCFVGLPRDHVEDSLLHDSPAGRDTRTGERVAAYLRGRAADAPPFFAFVFLDAPHQVYSYPKEHEIFVPAAGDVDYLALSTRLDAETTRQLFNRYRNSVHYADAVIGTMLDALAAAGLDPSTVVLITGDHGEEFGENGFWGHTSDFCDEQVRVPLLVRGPGVVPGLETRPTSHLDLPATLLEACGVEPSLRPAWTIGENLFAPIPGRRRLLAGWDRFAIWTDDAILWVPFASRLGGPEARDHDWVRLDPDAEDAALARNADALTTLARDCGRWFR